MEDEIEPTSGSAMVPIALALLAVLLGGAGLYFGMTANQQLSLLSESIEEGDTTAAESDKQISSLERRVIELTTLNEELKGSMQRLGRESSQTLRVAKQAEEGVASNREEMVKLAGAMQQMANSGSVRTRTASTVSVGNESSESVSTSQTSASGSGSVYKIKSGDTFGKIANEMGVSLNALLDANSDADPRRLSIGQEIIIPGS